MIGSISKAAYMSPMAGSYAPMRLPRKIWVLSPILGKYEGLNALHQTIFSQFQPGDRVVYTGNILGQGTDNIAVMNEIIFFRRLLLSVPSVLPNDIIFLRGAQEEMFQKLFQLTYAPGPVQILEWMFQKGVASILDSYHLDPEEALRAARNGPMKIQKWIEKLRQAQRRHKGHMELLMHLRKAAYSVDAENVPMGLLVVSSGLKWSKPMDQQGDNFWWGRADFNEMDQPYGEFTRIVRGLDPAHAGVKVGQHIVSLDVGEFGAPLLLCQLDAVGVVESLYQA